jgi:hypothetical protein
MGIRVLNGQSKFVVDGLIVDKNEGSGRRQQSSHHPKPELFATSNGAKELPWLGNVRAGPGPTHRFPYGEINKSQHTVIQSS